MANEIEKVVPPAIPMPTEQYDRPYMDQMMNVLRLFFVRLTNLISALFSTEQGGKLLYMPNGLFYSTTDQSAALADTGYPVEFENTYLSNGISIIDDTKITVDSDGVYNFQVSLQLEHNSASACALYTWINKNGTDVAYGGHESTIKGNDYYISQWNFSIDLTAGQYIEMYWATDDTGLNLHSEAATTPHPGIPSAVVAVSFVSNY